MALTIMRNLQLSITNVHIRYEHPHHITRSCLGMGLTFASLEVHTCNAEWKEQFVEAG